jgi:hypothetical protein
MSNSDRPARPLNLLEEYNLQKTIELEKRINGNVNLGGLLMTPAARLHIRPIVPMTSRGPVKVRTKKKRKR